MKRNNSMKRVLAMLLVIIMVVTGSGIAMAKAGGNGNGANGDAIGTMGTVSADAVKNNGKAVGKTKNDAKAKALYDLGLFKGISTKEFIAALESGTTRIQAIKSIGVALGWDVKKDGFKYASEPIPKDLLEYAKSGEESKLEMVRYVQYALAHDITKGIGNGHFGANLPINARMLYTWYARALMETEVWTDLNKLVELGFVTAEELKAMNLTNSLTRDDLVGVMYASLNWKMKNSDMKLFQYMLKNMWFDYKAAVKAGLTDAEEKELTFDIKQLSERTLLLTFSHALEEGPANNKNNYTVQVQSTTSGAIVATPGAITVSDYSVSASGKEVYLVFDKNLIGQDNEKDIVGDKVFVTLSTAVTSLTEKYTLAEDERTKSITIREDNTAPAVSEIHVVKNTQEPKTYKLHFVFSEPIVNLSELKSLVKMTKDTKTSFFSDSSILSVFPGTEAYLSVPAGVEPGRWQVNVAAGLEDQDNTPNTSPAYSQYVTIP